MFNFVKERFRKLRLSQQLKCIVGIPVTALVLVGLFMVSTLLSLRATQERSARDYELLERCEAATVAVLDSEVAFRGFALSGDGSAIPRWRDARKRFDEISADVKRLAASAREDLNTWGEIERDLNELLDTVQKPTMDVAAADLATAKSLAGADFTKGKGPELTRRIRDNLNLLAERVRREQRRSRSQAQASGTSLLWGALGGILVGAVVAAWIANNASLDISSRIKNAVDALSSTSSEIAASVTEHERTASIQAASVSETTATMDELDASFQHSGEIADAAAERASEALKLAEEGNRSVRHTVHGMESVRDKVAVIAEQILRLSEQTSQIGNITILVSDLANQTNLLALNAAVEAARAGEHGRGFAVVASEIRKLADQSKQSADRIRELVGDVQNATNATVMATEEGTKTVQASIERSQVAARAFDELAHSLDTLYESAQQSSLGIRQQIAAVRQVVEAMDSVNAGARETASGIGQTKVGVDRIQDTSAELRSIV